MAVGACQLVLRLEELIAAIDRRVPRAERVGEAALAREAAALRAKAVDRLAEVAHCPTVAVDKSSVGPT